MPILLCRHTGNQHADPITRLKGYRAGDVVTVRESGSPLGRKENPEVYPASPFVIVRFPGPRSDYLYLLEPLDDGLILQTDPNAASFGAEIRTTISKRRHHIDPQLLTGQARANWARNISRGQGSLRVDVATAAAFEAAVLDRKDGDRPINPNTVVRGKRR